MIDDVCRRTVVAMGTLVTLQVVGHRADKRQESVDRAFGWFHEIEARCSRFDPESELMALTRQVGVPVPVSAILFEAVAFAVAVAEETGGAFDPTVGRLMESRGFDREHRTGRTVRSAVVLDRAVTYRDVRLDPQARTITLERPLVLDLGAVAKGLAIDMAARELTRFVDFSVDAGGDLYLGGHNAHGAPWSVGIRHPRNEHAIANSLRVSDHAVCTSGDYERRSPAEHGGHHIVDPRSGEAAEGAASVTVVAPTAMLADALATAAFVMGPADGLALLDRLGVDGLFVSPTLDRCATRGMRSEYHLVTGTAGTAAGGTTIFSHAQRAVDDRAGDARGAGRARQGA